MKRLYAVIIALTVAFAAKGQALRGTTGLLHAPSAEMQKPGTFMMGGNVLDLVPMHWYDFGGEISHTYNYYLNVTFFPWLEVSYTCTLNYAEHGSGYFPPQSWGHYTNQDRSFNARVRLWKEGWFEWWTPQVVLGLDDPLSHTKNGGGNIEFKDDAMWDNHFTRYYLAATKHLDFENVGRLGAHVSWIMNYGSGDSAGSGSGKSNRFNRPAAGASFRLDLPSTLAGSRSDWWVKALNGIEALAEYDARTFNVGLRYTCWKERIHLIVECNDLGHVFNTGKAYWSGGVYLSIPLGDFDSFTRRDDFRIGKGASRPW